MLCSLQQRPRICAKKRQVPMKQGKHYLARVYFHCQSINIPVYPCVRLCAPVHISAPLAPSCSRSFISGGPAWPQRCPACRRSAGPGPAPLVLPGRSGQVFFLRLTEEQWMDMYPLFSHAEQEKLLAHLYAYTLICQLPACSETRTSEIPV